MIRSRYVPREGLLEDDGEALAIDLGPLEPRVPDVLPPPSGKIELAPAAILAGVARLRERVEAPLCSRRAAGSELLDAQILLDVLFPAVIFFGLPRWRDATPGHLDRVGGGP